MRLTAAQRWSWLAHVLKAATQQHHRELAPAFSPYIPRDAVVADVGAHGGQFAKLFARMAPEGTVHAFEPSAYARSVLAPALAFNRLRNVQVVPFGLSDQPGEAVLHTPVKGGGGLGFGLAHLGEAGGARGTVAQTIALTTLDAYATAAGLTRLDFIKADIEGWEMHALRGGAATLARFRPALWLEVNAESLARAGSTPAELWALLQPLGYAARRGAELGPAAAYEGPDDYLFAAPPRSRPA